MTSPSALQPPASLCSSSMSCYTALTTCRRMRKGASAAADYLLPAIASHLTVLPRSVFRYAPALPAATMLIAFGLWNPLAKLHCRLVHLLRAIDCKVNLIVFNTHEGSRFQPSTKEAVLAFRSILIQVSVTFKWYDPTNNKMVTFASALGLTYVHRAGRTAELILLTIIHEALHVTGCVHRLR